jgi:hypothetical protein
MDSKDDGRRSFNAGALVGPAAATECAATDDDVDCVAGSDCSEGKLEVVVGGSRGARAGAAAQSCRSTSEAKNTVFMGLPDNVPRGAVVILGPEDHPRYGD